MFEIKLNKKSKILIPDSAWLIHKPSQLLLYKSIYSDFRIWKKIYKLKQGITYIYIYIYIHTERGVYTMGINFTRPISTFCYCFSSSFFMKVMKFFFKELIINFHTFRKWVNIYFFWLPGIFDCDKVVAPHHYR